MKKSCECHIKKCPKDYRYYVAKLLFQYRVVDSDTNESNHMRPSAVVTVLFYAKTPVKALRTAKQLGKQRENSYLNSDQNRVFYEFVGVTEILDISHNILLNEVWVWFGDLLNPMERRDKLILTNAEALERIKR